MLKINYKFWDTNAKQLIRSGLPANIRLGQKLLNRQTLKFNMEWDKLRT